MQPGTIKNHLARCLFACLLVRLLHHGLAIFLLAPIILSLSYPIKGHYIPKPMAAEGSVDMLELRDLRQTIALLFVEVSKMDEKFATQEMHDNDFTILRRHIQVLEKNIENLMKEGEEKDARIARLEDEEIARIRKACGGEVMNLEELEAKEKAEDKAA